MVIPNIATLIQDKEQLVVFEEACRNIVCTGANPIGMVDHLQFGNPEDPEIFWTFMESLEGLTEYAKFLRVPCVGGKVSFLQRNQFWPNQTNSTYRCYWD